MLKNIFDTSSGDSVQADPARIDEATGRLIDSMANRPDVDPDAAAAPAIQEAKQRAGFLTQPGMNEAIQKKYESILGQDLTALRNQSNLNQRTQNFKRIGHAFNALRMKQETEQEAYQSLLTAHQNRQALRAQALNSIFRFGGTALGMAYGGPMGAQAGGMAGDSVAPSQPVQPMGGYSSTRNTRMPSMQTNQNRLNRMYGEDIG